MLYIKAVWKLTLWHLAGIGFWLPSWLNVCVWCQYGAGMNFGYLIPHLKTNKISTSAFVNILCQVDIGIRTGHEGMHLTKYQSYDIGGLLEKFDLQYRAWLAVTVKPFSYRSYSPRNMTEYKDMWFSESDVNLVPILTDSVSSFSDSN